MKDLLNNALCMLDDRHIEEAAAYTPQTKTIKLKRFLSVAACLVIVIASSFAIKDYFVPDVTTVSPTITTNGDYIPPDDTNTTVAGVIVESTTVANAPEKSTTLPTTTSAPTKKIELFCTTPEKDYAGWENKAFLSYYHEISIDGIYYNAENPLSAAAEPLNEEKLGRLLYEFKWNDYRFEVNGNSSFTVEVYEIAGYTEERCVAVGRKDGLMKGYYAYYRTDSSSGKLPGNVLADCQTLSDIINFADITTSYNPDNFCTSFWAYYKEEDKEDIVYSISIQTMEKLASLIIDNSGAEAEERINNTGEKLTFIAYLNGFDCEIYLCNDGYIYFNSDGITRGFNIGIENYNKYLTQFKLGNVVWTPGNPVTMG